MSICTTPVSLLAFLRFLFIFTVVCHRSIWVFLRRQTKLDFVLEHLFEHTFFASQVTEIIRLGKKHFAIQVHEEKNV